MRSPPAARSIVGFTLIELMILVVIGIILANAAIPSSISLDDQRVAGQARVLGGDIEFARARAIATSQQHRILFELARDRYTVESPPGTVLLEPLTKKPWIRELSRPDTKSIDLVGANFDGTTAVSFDAAGRPSHPGSVVLNCGGNVATITVAEITGAVTIVLP